MIILTLRTDKPDAEIGLYADTTRISYGAWEAHRQLAETIHTKISQTVKNAQYELNDIDGIVVYQGPGSFTGLRIGIATANALAHGLDAVIIAASGDDWIEKGVQQLMSNKTDGIAMPEYGSAPHITQQKK